MATATRSSYDRLLEEHCEVHFGCSGFWDRESMAALLDQLNQTTLPLVKARKPIYAAGDFTDFVPQDRETADLIQRHLHGAMEFGLKRVAIVGASALMKIQYTRLSKGLDVDFFQTQSEALQWLRANR
ncbi:MAG: STAS/SEC14 domain-containing protein [Erythrobacter sp.]|uniref:hypothetical protein n=1 Tax=Erythrobacter sp. TaxID=1042 RepID=UPI003C70BF23